MQFFFRRPIKPKALNTNKTLLGAVAGLDR